MAVFGFMLITVFALCAYAVIAFYTAQFCPKPRSWRVRLCKIGGALVLGLAGNLWRVVALGLVFLAAFLGINRLVLWILKKAVRTPSASRVGTIGRWLLRAGIVPVLITAITFGYGSYNMNHIDEIRYTVRSDKLDGDYRVVFLSDIHYATVQRTAVLRESVDRINALGADLVILGGDLLDEGTSHAEMEECFAVLGDLKSTYGTYLVFGNHDRQRYADAPAYTEEELIATIEANGITILTEELVPIGDDLLLLGREDMGARRDCLSPEALAAEVDTDRFLLTADHQPNRPDEDAAIGTDLLLSGHTHSGQIFPVGHLTFFFRGYIYGRYEHGDMTVLVSSGFAGWGFPIRTQGESEYLVVDLISAKSGGLRPPDFALPLTPLLILEA